jgi:hypothetical protein
LTQYEAVRTLVVNDKPSLDQIDKEIAALQGKAQAGQEATANTTPSQTLNVNKPEAQLPVQNPPVKIPAPPTATRAAQ